MTKPTPNLAELGANFADIGAKSGAKFSTEIGTEIGAKYNTEIGAKIVAEIGAEFHVLRTYRRAAGWL